MKIFIKRTIVCLLCMLSVVSFTACEAALQQIGDMLIAMQSSGSEGESSQDSSSPQDSDVTSTPADDTPVMSSSVCGGDIFTVDMQFPVTSKSSMALVELIQVYEDFFTPIGSDEKFIIAEYRVVKDYYHHFSENTVINVPFKVFHTDEETTPPNIIYGESSDCASDVEVKQMDPTIFSSFLQRYQKVVLYTTFLN